MRIMNGDRIVARSVNYGNMPLFIKAEPGTTMIDLPIPLFGMNKREVTYEEFLEWIKIRCFPPERVDADIVLKRLGLKKYDVYDIVRITKGVMTGDDKFWIDFDNT